MIAALYDSFLINVNVSFQMSFHRVLPLLPALSDQALRDRWAIQPDALKSSKIMPDETLKAAASEKKSPTPANRSFSSPPEEGVQKSPGEESLEDYESPKNRTHSLSQAARTGDRHSRADQSSAPRKSVVEKWQEDSPSSIPSSYMLSTHSLPNSPIPVITTPTDLASSIF